MTLSPPDIVWGARSPRERGPVVAGLDAGAARNAIGVHAGAFGVYQALAVATGALARNHRPDLADSGPAVEIGPAEPWFDPFKIVTLDPWGHRVGDVFARERSQGLDARPSIAVARGQLRMAEIDDAVRRGRLRPDGAILAVDGAIAVTKIAIEPVWWLPGVAARLGLQEGALRAALHQCADGMYPALVDQPERKVFLPPIGGASVYVFGSPARLRDPRASVACRIHDECCGSDVFGSDLCTCRPYLAFGVEEAIRSAQSGGAGLVVYNRKEGRALGEVVKLLVYNARAQGEAGDRPEGYFTRTEKVAGVCDMRFQSLSTDVLHWLGVRRIDRWVSMSDMKADALAAAGIEMGRQVVLPEDRIPEHAGVEMAAKRAAGYFAEAV